MSEPATYERMSGPVVPSVGPTGTDPSSDGLDEALDGVLGLLRVETAGLALVDPSRRFLITTAARGREAGIWHGTRTSIGVGVAGRVAADRAARSGPGHGDSDGAVSLLGVPLLGGRRLLGVLVVGERGGRSFTAEETSLLQRAGDRIAASIAVGAAAAAERAATTVLQHGLGSPGMPRVPGLELAARYLPAGEGEIGGDWYDVLPLPSGATWIVVGDVAGRGLPAVLAAGRVGSALRAHANEVGGDPAELLRRLDRHLCRFEPEVMATVLCALVDPDSDRIVVSSAGHPPAVVSARADALAAVLDVPVDLPLGVDPDRRRRAAGMTLPPGTTVCLYTDGLVASRDRAPRTGIEQLCRTVFAGAPEVVCAVVLADLVGDRRLEDDVAVLVVRRPAVDGTEPLTLQMPASPASLEPMRAATRRWLAASGQPPASVNEMLVAIGEAVANVVEHAYGPRGGDVYLHLALEPPDVVAMVRDTGRWRERRGQHRGRGSMLIAELADEVRVDRSESGTQVLIRRNLRRSQP